MESAVDPAEQGSQRVPHLLPPQLLPGPQDHSQDADHHVVLRTQVSYHPISID